MTLKRRMRMRNVPLLQLPELMEASCCCARLIGARCVLVENHSGLRTLRPDEVTVRTEAGELRVRGRGLSLSELRPDAMLVHGIISDISCLGDENE